MIEADRLNLKATVVQGISQNISLLVNLYSQNLNSLGVQSAVIASLAYASLTSSNYFDHLGNTKYPYISGFYYVLNVYCLVASLLCVIVCSITGVYGPWLALTGEDNSMSIRAVLEMKKAQNYVFYWGASSVIVYSITVCLYCFNNFTKGTAAMISGITLVMLGILGYNGYNSLSKIKFKGQKHLDELFKTMQGDQDNEKVFGENPNVAKYPTVTYSSYVWKRREAHHGGRFDYVFANLNRGVIEIYKSKESYDNGDSTLEKIRLINLVLSLDVAKFHHDSPAVGAFSISNLKPSKFVLTHNLLFAVIPREDHEVVSYLAQVEFQAISAESKKEWISTLKSVDEYYSKTRKNAASAILSTGTR